MEEFHIPLKPEDLARPSVREDEYRVENEVHPELMKEKDLLKLLDDAEGRLLPNSTHQIVSHKNFDMIFGFLNNFASLSSSVRRQLLDLLLRGIGNLTQAISKLITTDKESLEPEAYSHRLLVHKNALKMYTFLLSWLISSLEKSSAAAAEIKPKGKAAGGKKKKADEDSENFWDSESLKEQVLSALVHILEIDLSRVWNLALPEETFLNAISNTMTTLLENPANCKLKSVRRCIFISLGLLVQRYKQAAPLTNALFHRLHNHEHLSSVLAQLMEVLCKEYDSPQVVGEFLREISRMNSKDVPQDSASVRNISTFIGELAELVPQQVLSNVSLLLVHLDSESYTMRNGVIHMVGRLLASNLFANDAANNGNDKHEAAQTRDSLFKILEDRFHDMNAFCRSKTLQTWAYLLSLHSQQRRIIPLKVLPVVTKLTIGRLEDKGARVREHAIQLLTTLLEANPFGPSLKLSEFRAKLEEGKKALAESEAKGAEADAETEKLRRSLQYYHDSTHFIEQLHSAVPVLGRLLGSKVNADVLETINFFVSATQFQLECASQGTRKMLPLIWSREAPIREAVTVAYEKLYANLAAVPSKAGAMHVAKNLIALTEGATLAEITSLEELVAMMMAKRSIPPPVIYLLWEIFGLKHPEVQPQESRGALVILSMIATSSPEMVKEKLPVLLGQGLGPRWKDDELLAKYSCIALQKLNDRADKTAQPAPRLRAEHEVFAKLSDVIKDPSPRTQWYSAAEQAVAAVYKLHERPDDLCSSLIKEMAANLFDETSPKATSSSELSKFVFVLGHVALKQLVHIEEIQSEMRRRREANEKKKEAGGAGKEKGDQAKDTQQSQKKKKSAIEEELGLVHGVTDETEADRLREVAERELVGKSLLGQFGALIVKICASPDKYTNPMLRSSAVLALCKFMCVSEPFCREQLPLMFTLLEKSEDSAIRSNIVIALGDMSLRFPNLIEPWTANIYARLRDRDERVKKNALMVLMHLILNDMIKVKGQVYEMAICMESEDSRIAELARLFFSELSRKGNHLYNILPDVISHLSVAPNLSSDAFKSIMKYLLAFIEKDKQTEALVEKLCHRFKNPAQDTVRTPEAEVTHARDVAFCLTVLNYNERVLKKLAECFKLYADKLVDDEVYNCIQQVLAKGRKSSQSKAETKTVIDELAARVEQAHATGVVDGRPMEGLKKPPSVRAAKPAAAKKARGAKPKARAAKAVSDDEEEELLSLSEDDDDSPPARAAPAEGGKGASRAAPQRRAAAKAKAKAVRKAEESSESESESDGGADEKRPAPKRRVASSDDDAASEVAKAPKAKTGAKRKAKAKVASDEEEAEPKKAASDKEADEEEVRKPAARKGRKQIVEDDDSDE